MEIGENVKPVDNVSTMAEKMIDDSRYAVRLIENHLEFRGGTGDYPLEGAMINQALAKVFLVGMEDSKKAEKRDKIVRQLLDLDKHGQKVLRLISGARAHAGLAYYLQRQGVVVLPRTQEEINLMDKVDGIDFVFVRSGRMYFIDAKAKNWEHDPESKLSKPFERVIIRRFDEPAGKVSRLINLTTRSSDGIIFARNNEGELELSYGFFKIILPGRANFINPKTAEMKEELGREILRMLEAASLTDWM